MPMGLDSKNRDLFNPKFTLLKNFLFDLNMWVSNTNLVEMVA
jgi:hypothetical protein